VVNSSPNEDVEVVAHFSEHAFQVICWPNLAVLVDQSNVIVLVNACLLYGSSEPLECSATASGELVRNVHVAIWARVIPKDRADGFVHQG
jgi:hypothetical protein